MLPAPEGRPVEVRGGGGQHADVHPPRLAVEPRHRPLPDGQGSRAALRSGMTAPYHCYDDGLVQLDREAITLRRCHFPSGTAKVIPARPVRGYSARPLGWRRNRFRTWGSSELIRWLPLDGRRPLKLTLITLDVPGTWPRPAFTPTDPDRLLEVLGALLDGTRHHLPARPPRRRRPVVAHSPTAGFPSCHPPYGVPTCEP
jgi:hypothetical protein